MPTLDPLSLSPGSVPNPTLAALPPSFFHDVVSSLRNGVMVITSGGHLAHLNREACRILDLDADAVVVGARYAEVLRTHPDIVRVLKSAFELSNPPNRAELRLRPTGRVIGYTVCPVRDAAGALIGATLLFKDLTRVEQLEERERLRDRLAALGEMAAAIAHEVKNPLAGIKVMAGLLRRRLTGVPDAESLLNDIITEAKMADAIVLEILDFVRPIRLQVERTTLARLLEEALQMADSLVDRRATVVDIDLPPELPPLEADANQLRQLFTNLLTNAFEALEGTGRISVGATLQPTEVDPDSFEVSYLPPKLQVTITDNGPGVPADLRDKVFSPFFTTKARGSGLGLAIVRKIVDAHDGRIDMVVGEQGGTSFRVTLPIVVARDVASPFAGDSWALTGS
jgi:two-component system nitrogen regulation sensor histidine kinase GlnL